MSYSVFYTDHHPLPLPAGHRFPEQKYRMLRALLLSENIVSPAQLIEAGPASPELLALAHDRNYISSFQTGTVAPDLFKRLGFPWSPELFIRSAASVGGAVSAAESALSYGVAGCLAGGTHHAHFDRGEGYCAFNDLAVATRFLQLEFRIAKIAIIDLDVHQGNGNSSILGGDETIFVGSIHGEKNYPFIKVPSTLDIALPDGVEDDEYLDAVDVMLKKVQQFDPHYIFYQMGVDPLKEDKLGKMSLTHAGLFERDMRVLKFAHSRSIPLSLALGGGYAEPIELSVRAYANTYLAINKTYRL
jgi:acetoin utilization deacetylase AcuC-like enzyme